MDVVWQLIAPFVIAMVFMGTATLMAELSKRLPSEGEISKATGWKRFRLWSKREGTLGITFVMGLTALLYLYTATEVQKKQMLESWRLQREVGYLVYAVNGQDIVYLDYNQRLQSVRTDTPPVIIEYISPWPWERAGPGTFIRGKDLKHPELVTIK